MRTQFLLGAAVIALAVPAAASAQETTSSIRGTVTNAGTPVAGATVVATDVNSGTKSQTTTDSSGGFTLPGLRPGGPYTVEVTSPSGNKTVTDIFTVVQQAFNLPVELGATENAETGVTGNEVVVTATTIRGAGVRSSGPQTVLTQADVSKVASVNRDIRDIERRDPFATLDLSNGARTGGAVSFAGVNPRFNRFTINGVQVGDQFGLNQDASPTGRGPVPYDSLGQVSVSIAPYDFRQGNFQGGVIDAVLLSGTNEFHGTGFYSQNTDGLSGDRLGSNRFINPKFKSETYGATFRGPIIADKLFFMVSAERNKDPRPFDTPLSLVPGLNTNPGLIGSVVSTANSVYNYNPGGVLGLNSRKDEKIVGRIDANIATGQRLSLSYINAFDTQGSQNNTGITTTSPSYGLSSNAYQLSELLRAGIVQLNSDWTDDFSTEIRGLYKWYRRGQQPLLGNNFAQFRVCTDPTSPTPPSSLTQCFQGSTANGTTANGSPVIAFGPDNSRQTNQLFTDTWGGSFLARYRAGGHELKILAELNENRTFNNFLQNSAGNFYFDSLTDFRNRQADQLVYAVPLNGDPNGAAANFHYDQWTFGVQDDWRISNSLRVTYGFRWDLFGSVDRPAYNQYFQQRYGFPNTKTYKGLEIFQPRASFNWNPTSTLQIRGGAGIFGGGSPDIYLSNSFSNTILANTLTINRTAAAVLGGNAACTGFTGQTGANLTALCNAALNNVTGQIPQAVRDFALGANGGARLTTTGALARNFRLPSSIKATLSADYKLFGFNVGADYYYSKVRNAVVFTDARSQVIGTLPDGRPRYNAITLYNGEIATNGLGTDSNYDVILSNTSKGRSHVGVVRFDKRFDWGLSLGGSYTRQDVKDVAAATSSTLLSNYGNQAVGDPNFPAYGRSSDEITWSFKYNLGFDHAFFGDYRTVVQLFGETRAGRRYSFTMQNAGSTRSPVFGTLSNSDRYLLYVPTSTTDPIVSYDSTATQNALDTLINNTDLKNYRGRIAAKNIARARANTRIDLHLEQELPTGIGGSRVSVFADISNLPNLINHNWAGLRQLVFPQTAAVVQVQCLAFPVATGTGSGNATTNLATQPCAQYRYSTFAAPAEATVVNNSLYAIRLGARFTF